MAEVCQLNRCNALEMTHIYKPSVTSVMSRIALAIITLRAQLETNLEISMTYDARGFVLHRPRDGKASPALVRSTTPAKPSI
jgi:hypothetical protein